MRHSTKRAAHAVGFIRCALIVIALACSALDARSAAAMPESVMFAGADGNTQLVGYLYKPAFPGPHAAIVMLHGRSGVYSSLKRGIHTAEALSARHRTWGEFWARRGYIALLVDSFGPRGYPDGFPKHSYKERPAEVSERHVRPLDAYAALAYLRTRNDVIADRVALHGWSNGGMTVLSAMASDAPALVESRTARGFHAALAQYPSCRTQLEQGIYKPYAPLLILAASEDDEVSPQVCRRFADLMQERGEAVEFVLYDGAHHSYDDPGKTKQSHAPNRAAMLDTQRRAEAFFERYLKP